MPLYDYICKTCGHRFEHLARTREDGATTCPSCGAKNPQRQLSTFSASVSGSSSSCGIGDSCSSGTCPTGTCPFA